MELAHDRLGVTGVSLRVISNLDWWLDCCTCDLHCSTFNSHHIPSY
jgi:hypothetical protein